MKTINKLYFKTTTASRAYFQKLKADDGQFVMDHAVVFVLILALAAIALGLLITFMKTDLAPTLRTKIMEFFNYN